MRAASAGCMPSAASATASGSPDLSRITSCTPRGSQPRRMANSMAKSPHFVRRQDRRAHRDRAAAWVCIGNARRDRSHGRWSASQRVAGHWRGGTARSCRSSNRLAPKGRSRVRDPCVRAAKDKRWRAHRAARPCWRQARKAPPFPGAAQERPSRIEIAAAADGDGLCQRPPFRAVRQLSTVDLVGSCEKRRSHFRSFVEEFFNDAGRRLGMRAQMFRNDHGARNIRLGDQLQCKLFVLADVHEGVFAPSIRIDRR
jgi:hypothetical protein